MTRINFLLPKENDRKTQLRFVKCCTLVVSEGYHILLSPLNRLIMCHFIMSRMYIIRTSWENNQWKRKCSKLWQSWGVWAPQRLHPLRKFLDSKEYLDWLNNTGRLCFTQFSTRIYWNTTLATPDLIPMFTQLISIYYIVS